MVNKSASKPELFWLFGVLPVKYASSIDIVLLKKSLKGFRIGVYKSW